MTAIAVLNRKGGVGKTTTAIALGELAARIEGPAGVTVVDLDPQGDASTWADLADSDGDPLAVSVVQPDDDVTAVRLPGWIRREQPTDRLVILDCPPGGIAEQEAAAEIVAERGGLVIVPTTADPADATSTATTLLSIAADAKVAVLLVRMESGTIRAREIRPELEQLLAGDDENDGLDLDALVMASEVPRRAEISREAMAPITSTSLLLNAYKPVYDEIRELIR